MLKIGKKSSTPQKPEEVPSSEEKKVNWFKKNQHPLIILGILVVAFLVRFVFAFGISADSEYALSGGTSASEHLRTITEIMQGHYGLDGSLFYPFGSISPDGALFDIALAGLGCVFAACGMGTTAAAAAALSWSAVVFGVLACIPMYLLGKEIVGSKVGGYLAAIFLALCPIAIINSVFSNGTTISFAAFLVICLLYVLYKGVQLSENPVEGKSPLLYSVAAGVIMAILVLSTSGFHPIIVLLSLAMAVAVLINRFRAVDTWPVVKFFSIPIIFGVVAAAAYYIPTGQTNMMIGTITAGILAVVLCALFAAFQKINWTRTIPAFVIVTIIGFIIVGALAPSFCSSIFGGNSPYVGEYGSLVSATKLSFSTFATYFGFVTMWFAFAMIAYRLLKIGKNITSPTYVFILVMMIVGFFTSWGSNYNAAIFAPIFAIGFAVVLLKWIHSVNFKAYKESFRGTNIKTVWKKLIKPVPFLSILAIVFIICVPAVSLAMDAGIPTNDTNNPLNMGASGYYVKSDSDYVVNPVFKEYAGDDNKGSLVTWIDYSADAATFGKFDVITDQYGRGTVAASNILLSNGTNGGSIAAMMCYIVYYNGIDDMQSTLIGAGMTSDDFNTFKNYLNFSSLSSDEKNQIREELLQDYKKYGILSSDVSDENVAYLRAVAFLTEKYQSTQLSEMYDAVCAHAGKSIEYVMISSSMIPLYYGYDSSFAAMAKINGYSITDAYGTVPQFLVKDWLTQYYGIFSHTEAMYNSLMWRGFIGKSPAESGLTDNYGTLTYINGLTLSDGAYKATPGFGLANFEVDYSTWYVDYNEDKDATVSSDGWEKMLYTDAVAKQEKDGGLINYLAGYPVFLKYVSTSANSDTMLMQTSSVTASNGITVDGIIVDADNEPLKGVRVAVFDENGIQHATAFTDENGYYSVFVKDPANSRIEIAVGTDSITGGTVVYSTTEIDSELNYQVLDVVISGTVVAEYKDDDDKTQSLALPECNIVMIGQHSKMMYSMAVPADGVFKFDKVVPDTYDIKVVTFDGKQTYATKTYLTPYGETKGLRLEVDQGKLTVTVKDPVSNTISDVNVTIVSSYGEEYKATTDKSGIAVFHVVPGTYVFALEDYICTTSSKTIKAGDDESQSITAFVGKAIPVTGANGNVVFINNFGYQTAYVVDESLMVPTGIGYNGMEYKCYESIFGVYSVKGDQVYLGTTEGGKIDVSYQQGYFISGKLQNSSDADIGGKITFIDVNDPNKMVTVTVDKDNGYGLYLPKGDYIVYATNDSQSYLGKISVSEDMSEKNFKTVSSRTLSGITYWYTSSYKIQYMPIEVKITMKDGDTTVDYRFNVITNSVGSYSFCIPTDNVDKYELTAKLKNTDIFYFLGEDSETHLDTKTYTNESGDFKAHVNDVKVRNDNPFTVKVDDKEYEPKAEWTVNFSATSLRVNVDYVKGEDGFIYNYLGDVNLYPTTEIIPIKVDATKYREIEFTDVEEDSAFKITPITDEDDEDDEEGLYHNAGDNKYYFEVGKEFEVRVLAKDNLKIWFYDVSADSEESSETVKVEYADSINILGYVGMNESGKITINGRTFDVTSGRYNVWIVATGEYDFYVEITKKLDDDKTLKYTAEELDVPLVPNGTRAIHNMAVTGPVDEPEPEPEVNSSSDSLMAKAGDDPEPVEDDASIELELTWMEDLKEGKKWAMIEFTAKFTTTNEGLTYVLSKGTAWNTLMFYSDEQHLNVITSINGSCTIYCVGTIDKDKVAEFDENLKVIVKDVNDKDICKAGFSADDTDNWKCTVPDNESTKVNYGNDIINGAEYQYAMTIVNDDNFTKYFDVEFKSADMFPSKTWILEYVYTDIDGNTVYSKLLGEDGKAKVITVPVKGYTTATIYIKATTITGKLDIDEIKNVFTEIRPTSDTSIVVGPSFVISTDEKEGISISTGGASVAKVESQMMDSDGSVDYDVNGRGMVSDKGSLPAYIWALVAIILILVILVIWLGSRRGVFSRKS